MTVVSIKKKGPMERGNTSHAASSLLLDSKQQDSTYVIALAEATRERKQAAIRISELARQAVATLLDADEKAACSR